MPTRFSPCGSRLLSSAETAIVPRRRGWLSISLSMGLFLSLLVHRFAFRPVCSLSLQLFLGSRSLLCSLPAVEPPLFCDCSTAFGCCDAPFSGALTPALPARSDPFPFEFVPSFPPLLRRFPLVALGTSLSVRSADWLCRLARSCSEGGLG